MEYSNRSALMNEIPAASGEEGRSLRPAPAHGRPSLKSILAEARSFPREALFLGHAGDGLPVLLNLYDPIPGPILITADPESGKTGFLQMIARAVDILHTPSEVQYGVITPHPEEWVSFNNDKTKAGIYSVTDDAAPELLKSLVTWAHNNKGERQSILLLIDDLEEVTRLDDPARQNLRWLLLRGPSRRVWPFVTLDAGRSAGLTEWMDFFRTRLFGRMREARNAQSVTGKTDFPPGDLAAGSQFCMREGDHWLKFRIPPLD